MSEIWFWSHFIVLLKSNLGVKQTHLWDWFVEQKFMLSSSFRCDQIYKCPRYDFGHNFAVLLKSNLGVNQTHLWDRFVEQKFMLSSSFRCDQIYKCPRYDFGHNFAVLLKSNLGVKQNPSLRPICWTFVHA